MAASDSLPASREFQRLILEALRQLGGHAHRRAIVDRALSLGAFSDQQRAIPSPPSHPQYPGLIEYRLSWALTDLKRNGKVLNPERGMWRLAPGPDQGPTAAGPSAQAGSDRLRELAAMPYRDYLRTAEWQQRRSEALSRAQHRCQLDRRHSARLEVHHNSYERRGREHPSDLIVLCRECHRKIHDRSVEGQRLAGMAGITASSPIMSTEAPSGPDPTGPDRAAGRFGTRRGKRLLASGVVTAALIAGGVSLVASHGGTPSTATNAYDCKDVTYAEAQRILEADPSDPNHLDANHDGRACDSKKP